MVPFEARLKRRQTRADGPVLLVCGSVIAALIFALAYFHATGSLRDLLVAAMIPVAVYAVRTVIPSRWRKTVDVRVDDATLVVGDRRIARSSLRGAYVYEDEGACVVRVERRRGSPLELVAPSTDRARALLGALGFDSTQAVARFRGVSRLRSNAGVPVIAIGAVILGAAAIFAVMAARVTALPAMGMPLVLLAAWACFVWPSRVEVGPDGVRYVWLHWRTFIPAARIRGVEQYARRTDRGTSLGVKIEVEGDDPVQIPIGPEATCHARTGGLVERIREIRGTASSPPEPIEAHALLARGDRSMRDWIAALRELARAPSYRSVSLDLEELSRIVGDARALPRDRAAAAVALASDDEGRGRVRVRVAAGAIVDPKLRIALEAAAEADEGAIEESLEALSDSPPDQARSTSSS
jgi:hypothetical protein